MFAFALALAIPFTLFALFPGWMSALPKSDGWLNSVKVTIVAHRLSTVKNADNIIVIEKGRLVESETWGLDKK